MYISSHTMKTKKCHSGREGASVLDAEARGLRLAGLLNWSEQIQCVNRTFLMETDSSHEYMESS